MIKYSLLIFSFLLISGTVAKSALLENISKLIINLQKIENLNLSTVLENISELISDLLKHNTLSDSPALKNIATQIKSLQKNKTLNYYNYFQEIKDDYVRIRSTPDELIDYYDYRSETHTIQTADGYILTLHRITGRRSSFSSIRKPVVYLQHGLLSSSMDWIIAGPNRSLAFLLADRGYDVWLGNSRGNQYSRAHVTLSPDEEKFWDFSWHEIAIFDLPICIDHILAVTGNEHLSYVGHSQGTTVSYVLLSERPEYNKKITRLISLAPITSGASSNPILRTIALLAEPTELLFNSLGIYEVREFNQQIKTFLYYFCNEKTVTSKLCKSIIFLLFGESDKLYDAHLYPIIMQHAPAGSSVKQFEHYRQLTVSGYFRQFDYKFLNVEMYGSNNPPEYELENIKIPTTLFVGNHDVLSMVKDAKTLCNKLPNPNGCYVVPHSEFNHLDFLWGKYVKHLLYSKVLSILEN